MGFDRLSPNGYGWLSPNGCGVVQPERPWLIQPERLWGGSALTGMGDPAQTMFSPIGLIM